MKYVNKQKVFILSALYKRGSFHVAKVKILLIMCNSLAGNFLSGVFLVVAVAVVAVAAPVRR